MAKKLTPPQRARKDKALAKKKTVKNAEIARKFLNDPEYPIFKEQLEEAAKLAARNKATLIRKKGGDATVLLLEIKFQQKLEDLFRDLPSTPQNWLQAEKKMKAEEKTEKRYKAESA